MDLGKLGKRFRSELLRNPKKSAVLGIICLVALYFWLPLVRGWMSGGKSKKPAKEVVQVATIREANVPAEVEAPKSAGTDAAYRWDKLVKQRKSNRFASPRELEKSVRNPFELSESLRTALAAAEPQPSVIAEPAVEIVELTPQSLGLVLKGTIVGTSLRSAQINARKIREGESFEIADVSSSETPSSDIPSVEFTLTSVQKNRVVLSRGDKSYTLEFPPHKLSPGDDIVPAGTQAEAP